MRQEPFSLPEGFKWDTLQLDDPLVLKEVFFYILYNNCLRVSWYSHLPILAGIIEISVAVDLSTFLIFCNSNFDCFFCFSDAR